jgi:hypothetical protein
MTRLEKFNTLKDHAMYRMYFDKLKKSDIEFCEAFILDNDNLNNTQFWDKLKMLRPDNSSNKSSTKRFMYATELLSCSIVRNN